MAADNDRPRDLVTGELLQQVANSISDMIEVTIDVCSNHGDKKMPVLDTKQMVKEVEGIPQIIHEFYKKPMSSKLSLRAHTAYSKSQLRAVLIQETIRRLRNCSPESSWENKGIHLTEFAQSLRASGYNERERRAMFDVAVRRYKQELEKHMKGEKDMYRSREMREEQKKKDGGKTDKGNWFKNRGKEKTTSVMIVPYSGGVLAKEIQDRVKSCIQVEGVKTKIREGGGEKLIRRLMAADPFPRAKCFREDCPVIVTGKEGCQETCFQQHATYIARCNLCADTRNEAISRRAPRQEIPPDHRYVGETSRGLYERHKGHKSEYTVRVKEGVERSGFMHRHAVECHGGRRDLKFNMERTSSDRDPMRRVIRESVQILDTRKLKSVKMMNGKDEYFGVRVVTPNFTQE